MAQGKTVTSMLRLSQCKLTVVKGAPRAEHVVAGDVIRIGKVEENEVVLNDETVSRVHCEILRDPKGYLLRDLRSTNGTFLDGAEIKEAYLRPGSIITVGTVQLKFQPFDEQIAIQASDKIALGELRGKSVKMREIFGLLERIAPTEATLLIGGEAGTEKEAVARTVHSLSRRASGPLVVVDCGSAVSALLEGELFGHEKGHSLSANAQKGAFEQASGGTLFLDDVGELSVELQPKVLRALEQREIRRLSGTRAIKIDVRVIAGSRQDLLREVQKGKFREDLFQRLAVVTIDLPALRDRKEDLPLLIDALRSPEKGERSAPSEKLSEKIDRQLLSTFVAHDWPGNVRELRSVLQRGQDLKSATHLIPVLPSDDEGTLAEIPLPPEFEEKLSYRENKERWDGEFERRYLRWLMDRSGGNISKAAREADMDRKYLHKLLKKHSIA